MSAASSEDPRVFITVGTSLDPFDRLLRMIDDLIAEGKIPGPALAQIGACKYRPAHYATVPFLPAPELEAYIRRAPVVICHGGAGSIGMCLQAGRRPVVVPRRVAHGEIVNDHQLELCRRMQAEGRIWLAEDPASLAQAVDAALAALHDPGPDQDQDQPRAGGARLKAAIASILAEIAASKA
jgi:UDP-N-acetylglucosamine transferase subunit ALG13